MIICADDFGISPSVSQGIIELVDMQRLSAVSCMVTYQDNLDRQFKLLLPYRSFCDIGLHLNLTSGLPVTPKLDYSSGLVDQWGNFLSFDLLLKNILKGKIDKKKLQKEIENQFYHFRELTNFFPDFIDGHQHIQQLPLVRDLLLDFCTTAYKGQRFYLRVGSFPIIKAVKQKLKIKMLMGSFAIKFFSRTYKNAIKTKKFHKNNYLIGYHDYNNEPLFENIFSYYLKLVSSENDIFFMHPGYVDNDLIKRDSLIEGREKNLEFMKSNRFRELLEEHYIKINQYRFDKRRGG